MPASQYTGEASEAVFRMLTPCMAATVVLSAASPDVAIGESANTERVSSSTVPGGVAGSTKNVRNIPRISPGARSPRSQRTAGEYAS